MRSRDNFFIIYLKKAPQKVKTDEILTACASYLSFALVLQLFTRITGKCTRFQPITSALFFSCISLHDKVCLY